MSPAVDLLQLRVRSALGASMFPPFIQVETNRSCLTTEQTDFHSDRHHTSRQIKLLTLWGLMPWHANVLVAVYSAQCHGVCVSKVLISRSRGQHVCQNGSRDAEKTGPVGRLHRSAGGRSFKTLNPKPSMAPFGTLVPIEPIYW